MSKDKIDNQTYSELFSTEQREKALEVALDTRKFEIEMYWKRATYFWAFIAASFAGYFAIIASNNINNFRIVTILISFIGFCFSLGWYFVNRGSKFWQENWERHVEKLERSIQGPLFASVLIPHDKLSKINGHYSFSVSKVNQFLSFIITIVWCLMFVGSVLFTLRMTDPWLKAMKSNEMNLCYCWVILGSLIVLFVCGRWIYKKSLSFTNEENNPKTEHDFFLNHNTNLENMGSTITMGNDEFILYIRKQYPQNDITTKELGRIIWIWIRENDSNAIQVEKDQPCKWEAKSTSKNIGELELPKTATQFKFQRALLPRLYDYLDKLGQSL